MKEIIVYGLHTTAAIIQKKTASVKLLYFQQGKICPRLQDLIDLARKKSVPFRLVSKKELDYLAKNEVHQGVAALYGESESQTEQDLPFILNEISLKKEVLILILDCIEDPHNLGACLRSANAAGVDLVIAPKDRSAGLTPAVYKAASGACDSLPFVQVTNLANTLKQLKKHNIWVIGAAGEAEQSLYETDLAVPLALVTGNEGRGLRRLTKRECDILVRIPMVGSVSSLNVSVSTGICLFEAVRQRTAKLK